MATVSVQIDIEDWFESWSGDGLAADIRSHLAEEVLKKLKRDPRYKEFVDKQVKKTILELEK